MHVKYNPIQVAVPEIPSPNPLYPVMSDAVTFKYAENRGRYAVASKVRRTLHYWNLGGHHPQHL